MPTYLINQKWFIYPILAGVISLFASIFDNERQMSAVWTVPYFSGSVNYKADPGWTFSPSDYLTYDKLSTSEKEQYKFKEATDLVQYDHNPIGYLHVITIARYVFFWMGDIKAVEWLQILAHILTTILILESMSKLPQKLAFVLLYGLNPLILYVVTFPFYYYWQVIPSIILIVFMFKEFNINWLWVVVVSIILGFIVSVRPTTLFVSALCFIGFISHRMKFFAVMGIALLLLFGFFFSADGTTKNPWFTMYVGLGAYPNKYVQELTDNSGYILYEKNTGQKLSATIGGNYYHPNVIAEFREITKAEYLEVVKSDPMLVIRNAILNFFQSYSVGYINNRPILTYISTVLGFGFFVFLTYYKEYKWIVAIGASSVAFVFYYPPIQVYMFGSYVLIIVAFLATISKINWVRKVLVATRLKI